MHAFDYDGILARREAPMAARRQGRLAISELHVELEDFQPVALRAAELAARSRSDPRDQRRFVAKVRELLADDIQRGEPITPVKLHERARRQSRDVPLPAP